MILQNIYIIVCVFLIVLYHHPTNILLSTKQIILVFNHIRVLIEKKGSYDLKLYVYCDLLYDELYPVMNIQEDLKVVLRSRLADNFFQDILFIQIFEVSLKTWEMVANFKLCCKDNYCECSHRQYRISQNFLHYLTYAFLFHYLIDIFSFFVLIFLLFFYNICSCLIIMDLIIILQSKQDKLMDQYDLFYVAEKICNSLYVTKDSLTTFNVRFLNMIVFFDEYVISSDRNINHYVNVNLLIIRYLFYLLIDRFDACLVF